MPSFAVTRLAWSDQEAGCVDFPFRQMRILTGFGSGLARRASDPPGVIWAVGDRGPNLKAKTLVNRYGVERMRALQGEDGAKVMPRLDLGPAIARLLIHADRVELLETRRLADAIGEPVSGLPLPGSEHARCEPAFDLAGNPIAADPCGLDTEGIVALADGSFWLGDEFGPSLVRVHPTGNIQGRYVPQGITLSGGRYPVHAVLPAIASKRQLNRGFEAIAVSPDERWLFLAFQSPLAHPNKSAHEDARHVRVWRLEATTLKVSAQYLYPLDSPDNFRRDTEKGDVSWSDLKVSELVALDSDRLLVLERGSETTKIYRVSLADGISLGAEHLEVMTSPTVEELSCAGAQLPELTKEFIFSTDDAHEIAADLEGMVVLSPSQLLVVNDNDFGVEGAQTSFYRIEFAEPVLN